ncbi:hypothetical protein CROQUDRAFT_10167, partial [Cronartium quercuum f. sp. fusiforme G11]
PTPPSTPSHISEDSDSDSTTRAHSLTNINMSMEPNLLVIGTLAQRQAAAVNNVLSKITIKKPLDGDSWNTWSDSINLGLAGRSHTGTMYDSYIITDDLPEGEDKVVQKCLVTWLISNMNQTESDRALAYLVTYREMGEKLIDYKPALLWSRMHEYHASQSTHKQMSLQDMLDASRQGINKDLLKHIDEWHMKLKALMEAREQITEEEKCSRLARSLSPKWIDKVTD